MDIITLNKIASKFVNIGINIIAVCKYYLFDIKKYHTIIKRNKQLKDIYKGETCFILGNGPSLKSVNISLLKSKNIITVNNSISTSLFDDLQPIIHCITDKKILEQANIFIKNKLADTKCKTKFILHRSAYETFRTNLNIFYVYNTKSPTKWNINCSLNKLIPGYINVLPFATICAIYLGFNKIIYLGNDFSFFTKRKELHYYDIELNKKREESLQQDLLGCSIALQQYEYLYKFSKSHNVEIINATENSLLDIIPNIMLEDI